MELLIVDDHVILRQGLKAVLAEALKDVSFGEAGTMREALMKLRQTQWDILILDISFPGGGGLDLLASINGSHAPKPRVIVYSMHSESQYGVQVLREGADGYVSKNSSPDELVKAVRKVLAGGKYISSELAETLAYDVQRHEKGPLHGSLSRQEFRVLRALAEGKPSHDIADEMGLSVKTVSTYRARILLKMNLKSTAEIIRYAFEHNLLGSETREPGPRVSTAEIGESTSPSESDRSLAVTAH